jgi:hypothetical protein
VTILALGRLRQDDHESEVSLNYTGRPCPKKKKREEVEKSGRRVNRIETLCTSVYKWKNETCQNYSRNWGARDGGIRENDRGVNSSMTYLTYCKNF